MRAGDSASPEAAVALEQLCQSYWFPLYSFVRRKGHTHEDSCDLTQAFFARFLEKRAVRAAAAERGKFRSFLLASLANFLMNEWDKSQAQRRGGGVRVISMDEATAEQRHQLEPLDHSSPEILFERQWAQTVVKVVVDRLAVETEDRKFEVLKGFLLEEKGALTYEAAAEQLRMSVPAITSAIHRMRARFRELLLEEVARTVAGPEDVEPELRHLLKALSE